jgi:hypothetical protein
MRGPDDESVRRPRRQFPGAPERRGSVLALAARALDAERSGDVAAAVSLLATILDTRPGQMTLVHQWLPDLVRLSVAAGDTVTARAALERCEFEAAREQVPARASSARVPGWRSPARR